MIFSRKKNKYKNFSYSQSGEDLIVQFIFKAIGKTDITYLDIGAYHPYSLSNTALFYENGCSGINIEPDPDQFKEFIKFRSRDINLNLGIAEKAGETVFYKMSHPAMSTFSKEVAQELIDKYNYKLLSENRVRVETINNIIKLYNKNIFPDFLSVDAEGLDEKIIGFLNFKENFPMVICLETISYSETGHGIKNEQLINNIIDQGYIQFKNGIPGISFLFRKKKCRCIAIKYFKIEFFNFCKFLLC